MATATFDPSRAFIVRGRTLLCAGTKYRKGNRFDKSSVDRRLLRQLFDSRQIGYPDDPLKGMNPIDELGAVLIPGTETEIVGRAEGVGSTKPTGSESEMVDALAERMTKPELLDLAAGLEGIRPGMNKKAIALAAIRAGRDRDT